MKITLQWSDKNGETTLKPDEAYLSHPIDHRISKLDFLRDALILLQDEYEKEGAQAGWEFAKQLNQRTRKKHTTTFTKTRL